MKVQNAAILIAEDDENDQLLIKSAFKKIGVTIPIHLVNNGQEAIDYLNGTGKFSDRARFPFPTTMIIDLKMPIMDGFGVLEYRRNNPQWAIIPTVILSASTDLDDIKKAFMLGAGAYHVKPSNSDALRQQLKIFYDYWITCEVPLTEVTGEQLHTQSEGKLGERFSQKR